MIEIHLTDKEVMANHGQVRQALVYRLSAMGFRTFEGVVLRQSVYIYETYIIHFYPSRRDLIFKRFDRWAPPWQDREQKRRAILNRRFKL